MADPSLRIAPRGPSVPDVFTRQKRSEIMSRVKATGTGPEQRVRKLAHRLGYRFRLHRRDLPGTPDLVFPRRRVALCVHGCFCSIEETAVWQFRAAEPYPFGI